MYHYTVNALYRLPAFGKYAAGGRGTCNGSFDTNGPATENQLCPLGGQQGGERLRPGRNHLHRVQLHRARRRMGVNTVPEPKYQLTVISRTGKKVNQITGGPSDSITVYGDADLKRRLDAAAKNPDLQVTYRRIG